MNVSPRAIGRLRRTGSKQFADFAHASHERSFNNLQRTPNGNSVFLNISIDMVDDALDESVLKAGRDAQVSPRVGSRRLAGRFLADPASFQFGSLEQPLSCSFIAIKDRVFHELEKVGWYVIVNGQCPGVYDRHIHREQAVIRSIGDGMIQERAVHGLADHFETAKRKRQVRQATTNLASGAG